MTAHPEIILGYPSEFETCPDWVPGLNAGRWFPSISLKTIRFTGSIRGPTGRQEFETCPDWGADCKVRECRLRLQSDARQTGIASSHADALSVTISAMPSTNPYVANRKAPYFPPEVACSRGMNVVRCDSTSASPIIPGMESASMA